MGGKALIFLQIINYCSLSYGMESQLIYEHPEHIQTDTTISPPIIVDGQKNTTAATESQVVLQCYANSFIRPSITWFKRQEGPITSFRGTKNLIQYSDIHGYLHYYAPLESAGERLLTDGVYLSKLILNDVTESDTGYYGCVAMNYGGYKIQEAHLNVLDLVDDQNNDEHEPGTRRLFLFFLMPVGLALAPLTLWTCYVLLRKHDDDDEHKMNTSGNDYVQVNLTVIL